MRVPTALRKAMAMPSTEGRVTMKVGERCSMVTCAARAASSGTRVTAVAPLPMTTTRLPAKSMLSSQCCGWTTRPAKDSRPANSGV